MAYRFASRPDRELLVVVFTGEISLEEEIRALQESFERGLSAPGVRVLVDRRRAAMGVAPEDVPRLIDVLASRGAELGHPRVAQVVARDLDYGMMRMLELKAEGRIAHDFAVFRSLPEACTWLGVDEALAERLCGGEDGDDAGDEPPR